jgi:hypothetical protein
MAGQQDKEYASPIQAMARDLDLRAPDFEKTWMVIALGQQ